MTPEEEASAETWLRQYEQEKLHMGGYAAGAVIALGGLAATYEHTGQVVQTLVLLIAAVCGRQHIFCYSA